MTYFEKSSSPISLNDTKGEFKKLETSIKYLLYKLGDECENISYNSDSLDEKFLRDEYWSITDKLDAMYHRLEYLGKDIQEEGIIEHNSSGRYELPSGNYFTSGSVCEILCDTDSEDSYWVYTSIEHNGEDYYATALGRDVSIDGRMVRIRG